MRNHPSFGRLLWFEFLIESGGLCPRYFLYRMCHCEILRATSGAFAITNLGFIYLLFCLFYWTVDLQDYTTDSQMPRRTHRIRVS